MDKEAFFMDEGSHSQALLGVHSVSAEALRIERAGRVLLSIDSIEFGATGCCGIVGPNGAGKSLLVRTLCGLMRPDEGRVYWAGSAPDAARRHQVGLLLQRPVLLRRNAVQNIVYALRAAGLSRKASVEQAQRALEESGLAAVREVPSHRLSGGEQQRVALARALALKPDMLFLDEATANVDPASTLVIEQQLLGAMRAGLKVVMVSHDVGQVRRLANEVVLMHKGQIVEQSSRTTFFEQTNNPVSRRWLAGELLV
ncbi:energy-coupling factor ABC transporter ATP-binding protein [Granulosicoccus antarcticus]|uniref:Tungstate uptake system ATP-binding protein TupC n=1 Tax=Granulosicoccus antarcticus IMCC3135 TaxID=1192854 RepID=A0A2Z2NXU2_9GAMM|nr:ATP-binding cassette domain-containing protein [Granulosicoccus antarcticus]ASJ72567.1 Tungstate uptake system ATP-binding protein TupC [Granulosicoccus antarcticus IMCC3135]